VGGLAIIFGMTIGYIVITTATGAWSAKYAKDTTSFMIAKNLMGPFIIGVLVMSEFVGAGSTLGTAQTAYSKGISAAWNLVTLGIGFSLYAFLLAPKFNALKEYTISGALGQTYGPATRMAVSGIMIYALTVVNVSMYTGGAATLSVLLGISIQTCVYIIGAATIFTVAAGGLRGVGISNLIHITFKYLGLAIAAGVAWKLVRATPAGLSALPAGHFSPIGIGGSTVMAWTIANVGSVFCTQYVLQCICSLNDEQEARRASLVASLTIAPLGFLAAYIGMAARSLYPTINSVYALPVFLKSMSPWAAGIVTCSIVAATFVTIMACKLGATALLIKDFYIPLFKPSEKYQLAATRLVSILIGLAPVPFALYVPGLLKTVFFARALRTTIAVVVVFMFYLPTVGTRRSTFLGLLLGSVGVILWFLLGDPWGIDDIYIGILVPAVVMLAPALVRKRGMVGAAESQGRVA